LLATGNIVQPSPGNFLTSTATYQASANDPLIGQQLKIVLSANGNQGDFDNVRVNASEITAQGSVPEPSSMAMFLIGGVAVFAGSRRAKARKQ
jgi:PEP-CTERM motif